MGNLLSDLRFGFRMMARNPGFTVVAILTLALGIGANTAIFSVVNAVLLEPLPYGEPERIVGVWTTGQSVEIDKDIFSPANFLDLAEQNQVFEAVAAYSYFGFDVSDRGGEPTSLTVGLVSPAIFRVLRTEPVLGRTFTAEEGEDGNDAVVVLGHALWAERYGSDPEILGRTLILDGAPRTVVGVMPAGYAFPAGTEIWAPLAFSQREKQSRGAIYLDVVARLKKDMSLEQADAELATFAKRLEREYPESNTDMGMFVVPLREQIVGPTRPTLLVLFAAVGFVLLVGCANLANLLLASGSSRNREFGLRSALGASRNRLVRQLLTESVLLSVAGGALGVLFAMWGISALLAFNPGGIPRIAEVSLDGSVLLFTLVLSVLAGLLFGLPPAFGSSRPDVHDALKEGARGAGRGLAQRRLGNVLVVAEVAVVVVLLAGAGLMVRSFLTLRAVDPGFNPERVLSLQFFLPRARYSEAEARRNFHDQLLARVRSLPGVEAAGFSNPAPVASVAYIHDTNFFVDGRPVPPSNQVPLALIHRASPGFFRTLGIPLLRGRAFNEGDNAQGPPVVVIDQILARRHFPDGDPIGQRIRFDPESDLALEVVGVVGSVKMFGVGRDFSPTLYIPYLQRPRFSLNLFVRTSVPPMQMAEAIKAQLWSVDRELPADYLATAESLISRSQARPRFTMLLMSVFAALALLLAMVGIYGVIAYTVVQRTQEIGVRMALGADRRQVFRLILGRGMILTGIGVAIGLTAALGLTRFLSSLLFEVSATDPSVLAGVSLLLLATALIACYLPARRATRVDPMVALRYE